ncbi:MAG TPA: DNA-binding response regulator [Prolixibacteraceae bacterium]|nr:DNA-binding response regulator [Prolixibacteraceae bacterium]
MRCLVVKKQTEQNNIVEFVGTIPYFELVAVCSSVFEAFEYLQFKQIDLIFLDTDLPRISGIDFIKSLDNKPLFIFFSSSSDLAIEGFNLNALDFLLKPFSYERFLKAANKALLYHSILKKNSFQPEKLCTEHTEIQENTNQPNDIVMVKTDYQTLVIRLDNILFIEGLKDYIKIFTSQNAKPVITLNSLKRLQQNLPPKRFSRIHKSYIVGLDHIKAINKTQVLINDRYIPIGESYKDIFMNKLSEMRI